MSRFLKQGMFSSRQRVVSSMAVRLQQIPQLEVLESRILLATIIVTSDKDDGAGTLRDTLANAKKGDTIQFAKTVTTINLKKPLVVMEAVTIDASVKGVILDGGKTVAVGLQFTFGRKNNAAISGSGSNIFGLTIQNFSGDGILLSDVSDVTIGGINKGQANTIISNGKNGIHIAGGSVTNIVIGNYIGTNAKSETGLGNKNDGVLIDGGSSNYIGNNGPYKGTLVDAARNVISGNSASGVELTNTQNNQIVNNYIGTNVDGSSILSNRKYGVYVHGVASTDGNIIGGSVDVGKNGVQLKPANVISGNFHGGIKIEGNATQDTIVQGNFVGLDSTGTKAAGNVIGIIVANAGSIVLGDSKLSAGTRNIISGNLYDNILITDSTGINVVDNYIGTDSSGKKAVSNPSERVFARGISVTNGRMITIGKQVDTIRGVIIQPANLISGNASVGIIATDTSSLVVKGNFIGTDSTGEVGLSNGLGQAVAMRQGGGTDGDGINLTHVTGSIGGRNAGDTNVIASSGGNGIALDDTNSFLVENNNIGTGKDRAKKSKLGNGLNGILLGKLTTAVTVAPKIKQTMIVNNKGKGIVDLGNANIVDPNLIYANNGLGIDNGDDGVTTDGLPVLTSASVSNGSTTIVGTLDSAPSTTYILEFFGNQTIDPSGYGQGEVYLGMGQVTTDPVGHASFSMTFASAYGSYATATATGGSSAGWTSEFSADVAVSGYSTTTQPAPTVTALSSNTGSTAGGPSITITGTHFDNVQNVYFGDVSASRWTVNSATSLTVTIPPNLAGVVDVTVATAVGASDISPVDRFTYTPAPAPVVTALSISSGTTAGGYEVILTGTNFLGASEVLFGEVPAAGYFIASDTSIIAVAPSQATGPVDITVVTPTGTSALSFADHFTYTAAPAPTVTALSVSTGTAAGATMITITGTNFTSASGVSFGGVAVTYFSVLSDTNIVVATPAQVAATVHVIVATGGGTSAATSSDLFTYSAASAPVVSAVTPGTGSGTGGTNVTILGTGFTAAIAVSFGGTAADFRVIDDDTIVAIAPAGLSGTLDITVNTTSGTSATSNADQFTYTAVVTPTVSALSTNTGTTAGGTQVILTGTGFLSVSALYFGDLTTAAFVVNSDTQLTALAPAQASGTIDVTVASTSGISATSTATRFTYNLASAPSITSLGTATGSSAGGTSVLITGTNFTGATGVSFGAIPSSDFVVLSDTQISVTAPSQTAGTVDVRVNTWSGSSAPVTADRFVYIAAARPTVTGLTTTTGDTNGGTLVTITGTNFTSATAVQFGDLYAGFVVNSATSITAWAPPQFAETVHVTVTTGSSSTTSSADQYTYTAAAGPAVTGLTLTTGATAAGDTVVILGSGFSTAVAISFGGVAATNFQVLSDNAISVQTPMQAAGTVHVRVMTYSGTSTAVSADQFTYTNVTASAPAVTALDLTTGSTVGGQTVTITGTHFTGTSSVSFGGTAATSFLILSDTQIVAVAPAKSAGTADVQVTTNNGTSTTVTADQFTYLATAAPAVTSLGTASGTTAGGTSVTITGTNFTGATQILFGQATAASFTVNSATSITAVTSAGYAGVVDVTVTTPSGTSTTSISDQYTFTAAPTPAITSLGTTSGTTSGGTSVTINGTNFGGATQVLFGGVPAASFTLVSGTQITAVTPANFAGVVDVLVLTTAGTSLPATAARFTFSAASTAVVTSLGTTTGSTDGGTTVVLTGTGFTGASAVRFGALYAASFTVNSATQITATTPVGVVGVVSVTVTTPTGISAGGSGTLFTYTAASNPTVTSLGTSTGSTSGGSVVVITGTGFTAATSVLFGTVSASFTIDSATQITATAPSQSAGTVDVTVGTLVAASATSSSDHFVYTASSAPTIIGLNVTTGSMAGGTSVIITGTNFTGTTDVTFGGVSASYFTVISDTAIAVSSPGGFPGTVDVQVQTASGISTTVGADHFAYTSVTAPTISSLSVTTGSAIGGTAVTLTGTGYTNASGVSIGGQQVAFTTLSGTTISFVTPAMAAGSYDVVVSVPGAVSAPGRFTYTAVSAPTVTSLGTTTGSTIGGTAVTITGTNFLGTTQVLFGSFAARSFTVLSSTSIQVIAPAASAAGVVDINVIGAGGTSAVVTGDQYTYTAASTPTLTAISLSSGSTAGGAVLNLTGTGFLGATSVAFGTLAAGFTIWSDTWITATAPPATAGSVGVTVASPGGTSSGISFTYNAPSAPTVTGLTVASGSTAGGYATTVTGTGFSAATGVTFGTTATAYTVLSDTAMSVQVPRGSTGTVDIRVTTAGGTSAVVTADHFTYSTPSAPTLTGLTPTTSSGSGGAVVTITGTNFTDASSILFGTSSASFVVNSSTQITALAPAHTSGTIDVTVITAGGTTTTSSSSQFTYSTTAAPTVSVVGPAAGPVAGGNGVLITGTGFLGASLVRFGITSALTFTILSDTTILATAPPGSAGTVDVTVTTPAGTSVVASADDYTYEGGPISGRFWQDTNGNGIRDAEEAGIANVWVTLTDANSTAHVAQTDSSGEYQFALLPLGAFSLSLTSPSGYYLSGYHQGANSALDSDFDSSTGTASGTLTAAQLTAVLDAGFTALASTTTSVASSSATLDQGQTVTFTATVSPSSTGGPSLTGSVSFYDGATFLGSATLNSGLVGTLTTSTLAAGSHAIIAVFGGDTHYTGSTSFSLTQTVRGTTSTTLTASLNPSLVAQSVIFTATVASAFSGTPGGSVVFTDTSNGSVTTLGNGTYQGNSVWTFAASTLGQGTHAVTAAYGGNANYAASSGNFTQTVNPVPSTISVVNSSAIPSYVGDAVTFTVTVGDSQGVANFGTVTFTDDTNGTNLGTVAANGSGVWSLTTSALAKGSHDISAHYSGSSYFAASDTPSARTQVVLGHTSYTSVVATSANPAYLGNAVTFTVGVGSPQGTANANNDSTVTFWEVNADNSLTNLGAGTWSSPGYWSLTNNSFSTSGYHNIKATYGGNYYFAPSESPSLLAQDVIRPSTTGIVSSAGPSLVGQAVTLSVSVGGSSGAAGSGTVTFFDGGTAIGTGTTTGNGTWTLTTSALSKGNHSIAAAYGGNAYFASSQSSASFTQVVNGNTSSTVFSTTSITSNVGATVTLTVSVGGSSGVANANNDSTVTFYEEHVGSSETYLGTGSYTSPGYWSLQTASLSAGNHSIRAYYGGNYYYAASQSTFDIPVTVSLNSSTTGVVTSSANPSYYGDAVTLSVAVGGAAGGASSGTVTFYDGAVAPANIIGAVQASGGVASVTTSSLATGSHSITASYGGNSYFAASASPSALAQVVNAANSHPSTTGVVSASTSYVGDLVTLSVRVGDATNVANTGTVTFRDEIGNIGTGIYNATGTYAGLWTAPKTYTTLGNHTITASYGGNTYYAASVSSAPLTLAVTSHPTTMGVVTSTANPLYVGNSVTFAVLVSSAAGVAASGAVTFKDGLTVLGTGTYQSTGTYAGKWTFTTSALPLGYHSITASYTDVNDYFAASESTTALTQEVDGHPSTTSVVSSSANPSYAGAWVTFAATVSGAEGVASSGTVTFKEGSTILGTGTYHPTGVYAGQWTLTISSLALGTHAITAAYGDGPYFAPSSSSSALTQTVNQVGTHTSTSVISWSSSGQSFTFSVGVSGTAGVANTGSVAFFDGATLLGTGMTNGNGTWTLTTSGLTGNHTITAYYGGNAYFAASSSSLTLNAG